MKKASESKQFEQLVARIEKVAAPRGAIVKSPDHIRDLTTGKMREVDASIRYTVGTADILIIIECRKRSRKADVTWLDELVTRRNKLGAAKIIAVSSKGFSDSAVITARNNGIELRILSEVSAQDLQDWFLTTGVVHVFRKIEKMECVVFFSQADGSPTEHGYVTPTEFEPVFYMDGIHSPFPAATLFHLLELSKPEKFYSVPLDGTMTSMSFIIDFHDDPTPTTVKGRDGSMIPVHHIHLSADVGYESAVCELESGQHHRYALPNGEIQRTTFDANLFGMPFEFEHQENLKGASHVSYRVKKPIT